MYVCINIYMTPPGERATVKLNSMRAECVLRVDIWMYAFCVCMCAGIHGFTVEEVELGLYKIFCYFEAFMRESILLFANTPLVWASHFPPASPTLLRNTMCPHDHPFLQYMPYNFGNGNIL